MQFINNTIVIKGGGEIASGVAWALFLAGLRRILIIDTATSLITRRKVSFSEAIHTKVYTVEHISAQRVETVHQIHHAWEQDMIAVAEDKNGLLTSLLMPTIIIDATFGKQNVNTKIYDAPLVVALGPGFTAGEQADFVIETLCGPHLGRIYEKGCAISTEDGTEPYPSNAEVILRAPCAGIVTEKILIGEMVSKGDAVMLVGGAPVITPVSGIVRGAIRGGVQVVAGCTLAEVDPSGDSALCCSISETARALGTATLLGIARWWYFGNTSKQCPLVSLQPLANV